MFKPCEAKVFSLQIHLTSWFLRATAVFILFSNMVTLRLSFKLWLSWKCSANSLLYWPIFDVVAMFGKALWKFFPWMTSIQDPVLGTLCSVNDFSFLAFSITFYFSRKRIVFRYMTVGFCLKIFDSFGSLEIKWKLVFEIDGIALSMGCHVRTNIVCGSLFSRAHRVTIRFYPFLQLALLSL